MSEFKCRISLGVKSETQEVEFLHKRLLSFVPQLGMSILLLGMDYESRIVHVGYVESTQESSFDVSLSVQNLNQHQINQLIENGWEKMS